MPTVRRQNRQDHWTLQARKCGYPARSVFKLEEIQKKWRPLRQNQSVLDIGAAPGSWTLFVLRTNGKNARVSALDLKPLRIEPPPGTTLRFLQGDAFTDEAAAFLREGGPYGCVLSDAAPSTSGSRLADARGSYNLVMRVIDLAQQHLSRNGNLVVKVFQGGDEHEIRDRLKTLFREIKTFRPKAVRQQSMETYMIGLGRLDQGLPR